MSRKKWITAPIDKDTAASLAENHSLDPFIALILASRGITEYEDVEEFFDFDFNFSDPYLITDMEEAVIRIKKALDGFEKICVYGDYDADGVTATALMYSYLASKGADVSYYIPDRITEGYGMNSTAVEKIAERGVRLIITVDNGIAAVNEIEKAKELGIDTVVTDHHIPGSSLPSAVAVVDPHREDCNLHFRDWAGVGVAFKLACALEGGDYTEILEKYADIIALGTLADVVKLTDENRAIVKYGIQKINKNPCAGINALKQAAGVSERKLSSTGVTFSLAPRINAAGRMKSAEIALKLLISQSLTDALNIAEEVEELNRNRHTVENEIVSAAAAHIEENPKLKYARVIVVCGEGWHHGVIGIAAAKIAETYGRPAIVITFDGEKGVGSARSIEGFSVYEAISSCSELLTHFGGHTMAAGLGIKRENAAKFFEKINAYAGSLPTVYPQLRLDCKLNPAYINTDFALSLEALEPFGAGNPQPIFGIWGVRLCSVKTMGDGRHLRLGFEKGGTQFYAVKFSTPLNEFPFREGDRLDLAVKIEANEYRGEYRPSVQVREMRFSGTDEEKLFNSAGLYEKYRRGEKLTPAEAKFLKPSRELLLAVFGFLKNQKAWQFDIESMLYRAGGGAENLCRLNTSLDVLEELCLIRRENGAVIFDGEGKKADLSKSEILKLLSEQESEP